MRLYSIFAVVLVSVFLMSESLRFVHPHRIYFRKVGETFVKYRLQNSRSSDFQLRSSYLDELTSFKAEKRVLVGFSTVWFFNPFLYPVIMTVCYTGCLEHWPKEVQGISCGSQNGEENAEE